jgi:adenylate kinase
MARNSAETVEVNTRRATCPVVINVTSEMSSATEDHVRVAICQQSQARDIEPSAARVARSNRVTRVNVVLMGPPGCGKGTQASRIARRYGIPHVSTGDILRAAVKDGSTLGRQVEATLASGRLVTDEIITDLVCDRLQQRDASTGFVLDGFPRTVGQAHALDQILAAAPLVVALIEVADAEILRRLEMRRVCESCRLTQSVSSRDDDGECRACAYCGGRLERRRDDDPATARHRLQTYAASAEPVIRHYRAKTVLASVDGVGPLDDVTSALCEHIDKRYCG